VSLINCTSKIIVLIPHNKPTLGLEEEAAALRAIRSGWVAKGKEVESFENEFCEFVGLPQGCAAAVSSGTAALFLAIIMLEGSEKNVGSPGYVCSALRNAVDMSEGKNVLVDVAHNSPNIDLEKLFEENPQIAIIPHMFGLPINLSDLKKIPIIEDCSHALGAKVNGKSVGLVGEFGIFSFYATKMITSGGFGGMLISKNKKLVDKVVDYIEYDEKDDDNRRFNFQMGDLQAAIGREQLRKLPNFIARREKIFRKYKDAGIDLLDVSPENRQILQPVRYRAVMKTKNQIKIMKSLKDSGITTRILNNEWVLSQNPKKFPNSLNMVRNTISLPIYPSLSDSDVEKIISVLQSSSIEV
jgi:perosamine synthetase|tara:strand:- start:21 stop:1088 length:1068 start_codon:yes stop_codon:yes gene_type:complete